MAFAKAYPVEITYSKIIIQESICSEVEQIYQMILIHCNVQHTNFHIQDQILHDAESLPTPTDFPGKK